MTTIKPMPADAVPGELDLIGLDGNAGSVIGAVARALKRAGNPPEVVDQFRVEARSGNYDHLLATAMVWTTTPGEEEA
jgi:hypothetical protein